MTRDELKAAVADKVDITGRRLTTGPKMRLLLNEIIDAVFDFFPQIFREPNPVTLNSNVPYTITIPSAEYPGEISGIQIFDSFGSQVNTGIFVKKGVSGSDKTVTLTSSKVQSNIEILIYLKP